MNAPALLARAVAAGLYQTRRRVAAVGGTGPPPFIRDPEKHAEAHVSDHPHRRALLQGISLGAMNGL